MKKIHFKGTNVQCYMDTIYALGKKNERYNWPEEDILKIYDSGDLIYENDYYATKAELLLESENAITLNTIRIVANGKTVAHIESEECSLVKQLIISSNIVRVELEICGGRCKKVLKNDQQMIKSYIMDYTVDVDVFMIEPEKGDVKLRYIKAEPNIWFKYGDICGGRKYKYGYSVFLTDQQFDEAGWYCGGFDLDCFEIIDDIRQV